MPRKKPVAPRYIAEGFKEDCTTLLSRFKATNSARFTDFLKEWQQMKFSLIYCGLNLFAEILEFTEEALSISKQFFLPPHSDIARIGALYLLYGVYTQQPTRGLVKIRMTPEDWAHSMEFIENIRQYDYADANFIFHSLCYDAAFLFTASDREYGLDKAYRKMQVVSHHLKEMEQCKELSSMQLLKPIFQDVDVNKLEEIRKQYEISKNLLKGGGQGMEFTSVTPRENIISTLKKVADECIGADLRCTTSTSKNSRNTDSSEDSPQSSDEYCESDIGHDRRNLRERAFKQKNRGQKHLESCLPSTSSAGVLADNEEAVTDKTVEPPVVKETPIPTCVDAEATLGSPSLLNWKSRNPLFFSKNTRRKQTSGCDSTNVKELLEEDVDDPDEINSPQHQAATLPTLDDEQ